MQWHLDMHGMLTFRFVWTVDDWVCVACRHLGMCGMQTFRYVWHADIHVCVECRHLGMRGVWTFRYVWNADIQSDSMNVPCGKSCCQQCNMVASGTGEKLTGSWDVDWTVGETVGLLLRPGEDGWLPGEGQLPGEGSWLPGENGALPVGEWASDLDTTTKEISTQNCWKSWFFFL